MTDSPIGTADPGSEVVVSIDGLRKSFGPREVLKGIDLEIAQGEVVCVIGPSGSGKSTLLRCVNLLEQPTAGSISVLGVALGMALIPLGESLAAIGQAYSGPVSVASDLDCYAL